MELKITKQLSDKAVGKPCQICREIITESEAATGQFQATQTHRGVLLCTQPVLGTRIERRKSRWMIYSGTSR